MFNARMTVCILSPLRHFILRTRAKLHRSTTAHSTWRATYVLGGPLRHSTNSAAPARRRWNTGGAVAVGQWTSMPRNFDNDTNRTIRCDCLVFIPSRRVNWACQT